MWIIFLSTLAKYLIISLSSVFLAFDFGSIVFLFTNSSCVEMRRLNIFSEGLEDIFKGSFFSYAIHI